MTKALVIVDVQRDFCEGGHLPVDGGNLVAERIADYMLGNVSLYSEVVFTQDWHEGGHSNNGGHFSATPDYVDTWPVHCIGGTGGARLHMVFDSIFDDFTTPVFQKGWGRPDYSGFQGTNPISGDTLDEFLRDRNVTELDIVGIAGDFCVKQTALDAVRLGYKVNILTDMVASVGGPEATLQAVEEVNAAAAS